MNKEKVRFMFHTMAHPFDGFYEIRHRDMGSVGLALLVVLITSVAFCLNIRCASFVVNDADIRKVNGLLYISSLFLLYILFCISNWAVTCLTNGEGRMKDILIATGYGMLPIPLLFFPATLISHLIAADEEVFYGILITFAVIWMLFLIICGNMVIHNYSVGAEIKTLFFTIVAMCIILFIILLFYSVISQMIGFFKGIYTETIYRF